MKEINRLKDIKTVEVDILESKPNFTELEAGYFFMIPNSTIPALRKLKLGAGDISVYLFMLSLANGYENSICYPSTKTLQRVLGLSRTQVMTSKKRLEELGLITLICKGGNSWGEKKANEYRVNYIVTKEITTRHQYSIEEKRGFEIEEKYSAIDYSKLL